MLGSVSGSTGEILLPKLARSALIARDQPLSRPTQPHRDDDDGDDPPALEPLRVDHPHLSALLHSAHLLIPPAQFGYQRGQAWESHPAYPDLLEWKDGSAPALLSRIQQQLSLIDLEQLQDHQDQLRWVLFCVVVAVARFVPVSAYLPSSSLSDDGQEVQRDGDATADTDVDHDDAYHVDGWTTVESRATAQETLATATQLIAPQLPSYRLATCLLNSYIRPLYHTSSHSGPTDPSTGRRRPPVPGSSLLVSPGMGQHAPLDDDPAWKAGPTTIVSSSSTSSSAVDERDPALGNWNVLSFALSLLRRSASDGGPGTVASTVPDVWRRTWFRFVPPLVALLEDNDSRFRLAGARMVQLLLLDDSTDGRSAAVPPSLLRDTGIYRLFEAALTANLHLTNDSLGVEILDTSVGALRALILCLTSAPPPPSPSPSAPSSATATAPAAAPAAASARFSALHALLSSGILLPWSFTTVTAPSVRTSRLVLTTSRWFATLSADLGPGVRRTIDAALEWLLCGWVGHVPFGAAGASLQLVLRATAEAIHAAVVALQMCGAEQTVGAVRKRRAQVAAAVGRCWTRLAFVPPSVGGERRRVQDGLCTLVRELRRADAGIEATFRKVRDVDPARLGGLLV